MTWHTFRIESLEEKKEKKNSEVIDEAGRRAYVKSSLADRFLGWWWYVDWQRNGRNEVEWHADKFQRLGIFTDWCA